MVTYEVNTKSNFMPYITDSFGDLKQIMSPQWQYQLKTKLSQIGHSNVGGIGWERSFQFMNLEGCLQVEPLNSPIISFHVCAAVIG